VDFTPNFALKYPLKDANLIDRSAQDLNPPIPALAAIRETIKSAVTQHPGHRPALRLSKGGNIPHSSSRAGLSHSSFITPHSALVPRGYQVPIFA
jgi:hypothetical protein